MTSLRGSQEADNDPDLSSTTNRPHSLPTSSQVVCRAVVVASVFLRRSFVRGRLAQFAALEVVGTVSNIMELGLGDHRTRASQYVFIASRVVEVRACASSLS
jgi:hypothetical protein